MLSVANFQRRAWQQLFSQDIYDIFEDAGFIESGVSVRFVPNNPDKLLNLSTLTAKMDETLQETLKIDIHLTDMSNDAGSASAVSTVDFSGLDLLTFPILTEFGFVINGSKKGVVSKLRPASGWYFNQVKGDSNGEPKPALELKRETQCKFRVVQSKSTSKQFGSTVLVHQNQKDLPLFEFLKACSNYATFDDILADLQHNRHAFRDMMACQGREANMEECARKVLAFIFEDKRAYKHADPVKELHERLYKRNTLRIGKERKPRFTNFISFLKIVGYELAEPVELDGTVYSAKTIVTTDIASRLDESGVQKVSILKNGLTIPVIKCVPEDNLTYSEIVTAVYHYYLLLEGIGSFDSQDNYCNRVIDSVAARYSRYIQEALGKVSLTIRKRMLDGTGLEDVITAEDLQRALKDINVQGDISKDEIYQQFDETNSLSSFEQSFRITSGSEEVAVAARDVQKSQYGRVDAFTTSESKKVGLNLSLSTMAKIDRYGFITTPVYRVSQGVVDKSEIVHITAIDERGKAIAPHDMDLSEKLQEGLETLCSCRIDGEVLYVPLRQVKYQYVAACQSLGPLMSMVPAANHDAGKRSTMAGNTQKQALPVIRRERPYVCTGTESMMDIGVIRGRDVIESTLSKQGIFELGDLDGVTIQIKDMTPQNSVTHVAFTTTYPGLGDTYDYEIPWVNSTIKGSLRHYRLRINNTHIYGMDDIVFYANDVDVEEYQMSRDTVEFGGVSRPASTISGHAIALGNNVKVLFKSLEGFGYEDAVIVNEDFARNWGLAVSRVISRVVEANVEESNGIEMRHRFTRDIAELSDIEKSYLDENGLPIPGTRLKPGQVLVGRVCVESSADGKIETSNACVRLAIGESGTVINAQLSSDKRKAKVTLGVIETLEEGDKVSGYHGNKGVVSRVMRAQDMPYTKDGVPDLVINPLGVAARQNLGQIIEAALGAHGMHTGEIQLLEPFNDEPIEVLLEKLKSSGIVETDVYDGRTGQRYPRKAMLGVMYFIRSEHISLSKFNACSTANNKLSPRTGQPIKASGGGQKYSELSSWCLESYGATHVIDTLTSFQSDDISGINKFISEIRAGTPWQQCSIEYESHNDDLIQVYLRTFGLNMFKTGDESRIQIMSDKQMRALAHRICNIEYPKPWDVIRDPLVFGEASTRVAGFSKARKWYGYLPVGFEFIQPIVLGNASFLKMFYCVIPNGNIEPMTTVKYKRILENKWYLVGFNEKLGLPVFQEAEPGMSDLESRSGICGLMQMLDKYDLDNSLRVIHQALGVKEEDLDGIPSLKVVEESSEDYDKAGQMVDGVLYVCLNDKNSGYIESRNTIMQFLSFYDGPRDLFVQGLLVPPIGYRPLIRKESSSAFDKQFSRIVTQLKILTKLKPGTEEYAMRCTATYVKIAEMTQSKIDDGSSKTVFEEFTEHKTKNSIVRDSVLAKRIRFSGRSVISVNSKLKIDTAGIPVVMATKIFEEHLVAMLVHGPAGKYPNLERFGGGDRRRIKQMLSFISFQNYRGFTALLCITSNIYKEFLACKDELVQMLEALFDYYYTMLNREPSLHKFSVVGFKGIPVWTNSIQLHPLACHGFNADFDGDQMSVAIAMHPKAQEELKELMLMSKNLVNPKDGKLITSLNQDMILGMYWATMFKDNAELVDVKKTRMQALVSMDPGEIHYQGCECSTVTELWELVKDSTIQIQDVVQVYAPDGRMYKSTAGRVLFNSLLPDLQGFTKEQEDGIYKLRFDVSIKKKELNDVQDWAMKFYESYDGPDTLATFLDRLKDFGFWMADRSAVSISIYDFVGVEAFDAISAMMEDVKKRVNAINEYAKSGYITEIERRKLVIKEWLALRDNQVSNLKGRMDRNSNLFMMIDSSARGDVHQLMEMCGIIGNISNAKGEVLEMPILSNYLKGLSAQDLFNSSYKARSALCATQLSTASVGETNRNLIYMVEHQHTRSESTSCSADATWIDLEYKVPDIDSNYRLVIEDVNSLPEEMFNDEFTRKRWAQVAEYIKKFSRTDMCYESTMKLITAIRLPRVIVRTAANQIQAVDLKYRLTDSSRAMLWYRAYEPSLLDSKYSKLGAAYHKHEGDPDLYIVGDEVIEEIEKDLLEEFPIYTIIGCKSSVGVCKRCFGLKYDTNMLPRGDEYVGYQAIQAIGEPTQQLVLDTHKRAGGQNKKASLSIKDLLLKPNLQLGELALVAPTSGILHVEGNSTEVVGISIDDIPIPLNGDQSAMNMKYLDGDYVEAGAVLTSGSPEYADLAKYAGYQRSQVEFWKTYLKLYEGEKIMARNFELLALSQAEFGMALEDKSKIYAGNIYPIQVLQNAGVPFKATILPSMAAIESKGKVYSRTFYKESLRCLGKFAVLGIENSEESNIGRQVLGELRSREAEKQIGVIKESRAELLKSAETQTIKVRKTLPLGSAPVSGIDESVMAISFDVPEEEILSVDINTGAVLEDNFSAAPDGTMVSQQAMSSKTHAFGEDMEDEEEPYADSEGQNWFDVSDEYDAQMAEVDLRTSAFEDL